MTALAHPVLAAVLPHSAVLACRSIWQHLVDGDDGRYLFPVADHESVLTPHASTAGFDGLPVDDDAEVLGVQQVGVDVAERVLDRRVTSTQYLVVFGFELSNHHLRSVLTRLFDLGGDRESEVVSGGDLPKIDCDDLPDGVLDAGGPDDGHMAKAGGGNVEAHPEEAEASISVIAGPSSAERVAQLVEGHSGAVVLDPDFGVAWGAAAAGEVHPNGRIDVRSQLWVAQEFVEGVIYELGDALPRLELDVSQDAE